MSQLSEIEIKAERRIVTTQFIVDVMDAVIHAGWTLHKITMNAYEYADLRKFSRDTMDIISDYRLMANGHIGTIFGIPVFCKKGHRKATFTLDLTDSNGKAFEWKYCFQIWHEPTLVATDCECNACIIYEIMMS